MRKYWKLLLVATAIVSALCFLFYKHQYDRLLTVLQVLDTFGSPSLGSQPTLSGELPWDGDGWQQVAPPLYIFSSYLAHGAGVATLAVATSEVTADSLSCWVWVDGSGAAAGSVSVQRLPPPPEAGQAPPFVGWRLQCAFEGHHAPYAVGYLSRERSGRRPVVSAVGRLDWPGPRHQLGLCVVPSDWTSGDLDRLAEFASFHAAVGVSRLWLYEPAPAPTVRQLLQGAAAALPARLVRWQLPFREDTAAARQVAADLLRRDCAVRTSGLVAQVAALNVTQLLVPRRHDTLQLLVSTMEEQLNTPGAAAFSFSQEVFCTDAADGPYARRAPHLTLSSKTQLRPALTRRGVVRLFRPETVADPFSAGAWTALGRPAQVNPVVGAVQLYVECGPAAEDEQLAFEGAAVRFKTLVVGSAPYVTYRRLRDASLGGRRRTPAGGPDTVAAATQLSPPLSAPGADAIADFDA